MLLEKIHAATSIIRNCIYLVSDKVRINLVLSRLVR